MKKSGQKARPANPEQENRIIGNYCSTLAPSIIPSIAIMTVIVMASAIGVKSRRLAPLNRVDLRDISM